MRHKFRGGWRDLLLLAAAFLLLAAGLFIPLRCAMGTPDENALADACRCGEIVRFHVMAHSDSPADQAVKHLVRQAVETRYAPLLADAAEEGLSALMQTIQLHLPGIEKTALDAARQAGFAGSVHAEAGRLHLPAKRIGTAEIPEGIYNALKITIGSGMGQNWWCVLYPRLSLSLAGGKGMEPSQAFCWHADEILRQWLLFAK